MQLKRNKEMEFERLKKSHKKQIVIGALTICVIGGALTFATTRAKYKLAQNLELAKGTINYKPSDFKVMAMYQSEDGTNYAEITGRMPSTGYIINESKSYCTLDNKNKDTLAKLYTYQGKHIFENLTKNDKCYLYFDKQEPSSETLAKLNITPKTGTPTTFASGATTDEGVYSVSDPIYGGTSYYWRGLVTNNYVQFADKCWRIVRINGDGSIRLIYDGTTCHVNGTNEDSIAKTSIAYNTGYNKSNYVGWTYTGTDQRPTLSTDANGLTTGGTVSNAKTQLESWYSSNITGTNAEKVVQGKYCNDRNVQNGLTWAINGNTFYYAAHKRIITDHNPSLACPSEDIYTLNVGLITADEVMYAGGTNTNNTSYYLYNGKDYWTMSPEGWFSASSLGASVFSVNSNGDLNGADVHNKTRGLRPVINLKSDVTFSGGSGTQLNPYVVQ